MDIVTPEVLETTYHPESGVELRDIPGYAGRYRAGADGQIYSFVRSSRNWAEGGSPSVPRKMNPSKDNNGYLTTAIGGKSYKVHQLVLAAYKGKRDGLECRHLNGEKADNRPENLEWGTRKENYQDSVRHGNPMVGRPNFDRKNAKLSKEQVNEIRILLENNLTTRQIAAIYEVSQPVISYIKNDKRKGTASVSPKYANKDSISAPLR